VAWQGLTGPRFHMGTDRKSSTNATMLAKAAGFATTTLRHIVSPSSSQHIVPPETSQHTVPPPTPGVHDFTLFESEVLPAWLSRFTVDYEKGQFSYDKGRARSSLYGTIYVINNLATTGRLSELTEADRDQWASQIDSFQNAEGWYNQSSGNSKYHAMGEATAALALLQRYPRYNNSEYESFAEAGEATWRVFYDGLYWNNGSGARPEKDGCGSSIHGCGQVIGSYPSVLAYTTGTKHAAFIHWWSNWLAEMTNSSTGTLLPKHSVPQDFYDSLGGGMATHGIQLGVAAGDPKDYPFELAAPAALFDFALSLQNKTNGVWIEAKHPITAGELPSLGSITLDGIFQAVRSSEQLIRAGRQGKQEEVRHACDLLLATSAQQLSNMTLTLMKYGGNSHSLPNVLAAVGECARAFPHLVKTARKWSCCARYV